MLRAHARSPLFVSLIYFYSRMLLLLTVSDPASAQNGANIGSEFV